MTAQPVEALIVDAVDNDEAVHIVCCDDENVVICGRDGTDMAWDKEEPSCRSCDQTWARMELVEGDDCPCPVSALRSLK